jgi:hypothetical protein
VAKHILYNASVTVNAVDLSDHVESVEYTEGINRQAAAAMSEVQDYDMAGTIKIGDVKVNFYQDYASGKVYATIHPLAAARTTFNIVVKPDSGSAASTNPQFTLPVFVSDSQVVSGARGARHMTSVTFAPAGVQSISAP